MKKRILYMMFAGVAVCAASILVKNAPPLSGGAETVPAPGTRPDASPSLALSPSESRANAPDFTIDRTSARRTGMVIPAAPEAPAYPEETPNLADSAKTPGSAGAVAGRPTRTAAKSVVVRPPLTYAERAQRARQVEEDADLQLARLDRQVGLTVEQATGAFAAYAKESAAYDPSIPIEVGGQTTAATTGGAGSGSAETQIYATLDEEQQAAFGQEMLTRDLWWTEIVAQLAADFPDATAATQPSAHQGDNIFDILNSK